MTFVKVGQIAFVVGMVIVANSAAAMSGKAISEATQKRYEENRSAQSAQNAKIAYQPQQVGAVRRPVSAEQMAGGGAAMWGAWKIARMIRKAR